ncbi:MAG: DUF4854 domain-containing protein [Ruminococcus sp.]|nr:DUF4854 domain-containing protein [Ruminococcus sp.]
MKKMIAPILILAICAFLAACSANSALENTADPTAFQSIAPSTTETSSEKRFASLEEYVDFVFADMDKDDFTTEYMTYTIYDDKDALVYDYTYNVQYDNVEEIKEKLDASYDPENETIQYMLSELQSNVAIDSPKIKYIYRNNDGTIITEQVYE